MLQNIQRGSLTLLLAFLSFNCMAYEPYELQPGTRAASMAGVFSPQADDSSAIWYNPAGLKRSKSISSEISFDYAQETTSGVIEPTATSPEMPEYGENQNGLRFAAGYIDRLPFLTNSNDRWGTGIAYFTLNQLDIYVDAPQSPINPEPFGLIEVINRQVSWMLGVTLTPELSIGGTVDFVWGDIECLQFSPCVDNDPTGMGGSLGILYDLYNSESFNVKIGGTWRSQANIGYSSTPNSGIGTVLELYIPNRPESGNLGVNFQFPTSWAFINLNLMAEKVQWSKAAGEDKPLPDYTNYGIGSEWMFGLAESSSISLRAGYRKGNSNDTNELSDFQMLTAGIGYFFYSHHSIDLGYEYRDADFTNNNTSSTLSISYSVQY